MSKKMTSAFICPCRLHMAYVCACVQHALCIIARADSQFLCCTYVYFLCDIQWPEPWGPVTFWCQSCACNCSMLCMCTCSGSLPQCCAFM